MDLIIRRSTPMVPYIVSIIVGVIILLILSGLMISQLNKMSDGIEYFRELDTLNNQRENSIIDTLQVDTLKIDSINIEVFIINTFERERYKVAYRKI
nr:hypothetical protein [uncultured Carboxylicivirga sp.]